MTTMLRATLLLVVLCMASYGSAQTRMEAVRLPALQELANDLAANDLARAASNLEQYLERHPCDAMMLYNLACVRSLIGDSEGALASLDRAFAAGYHDLERAATDDDLASLRGSEELQRLISTYSAQRVDRQARASFSVEHGVWSDWQELVAETPCDIEAAPHRVRVRVRPGGLEFEVDGRFGEADVVQFVVGRRAGPDALVTEQTYVYEGRPGQDLALVQWNDAIDRRADRSSPLEFHDGGLRATIPWTRLPAVGPPLEEEFGLNVRVAGRGTVALVPDPYVGSSIVRERRVAILRIEGISPEPFLNGALATHFVVGDSVYFDLGVEALGTSVAELHCRVGARDTADAADTTLVVDVEPDVGFVSVALGLDPLGSRASSVEVELVAGTGDTLHWASQFVALPTDWFARSRSRLDSLRAVERSIVEYHLFHVMSRTRTASPHDDPRSAIEAVARVGELLDRAEASGSVLAPTPGVFEPVAFRNGATDLYPGWFAGGAEPRHPWLLVATPGEGAAQRAEATKAAFPGAMLQLELVPTPGDPAATDSTVTRASRWLGRLVEDEVAAIVATATVAAPVLRAALAADVGTIRLACVPGFDPWPTSDFADIASRVGDATVEMTFLGEPTSRAMEVVDALRAAGHDVRTRVVGDDTTPVPLDPPR